ncbi:hypothetical protein F4677DRAFT_442755 [Hypoxylon crocopeplum]|nr:hypothetical protein F4677DRAFT_442755 [Hypoxylon crocopeplum]
MDSMVDDNPPASQTNSHSLLLEPVSGATLYELETARREKVNRRGRLRTGCAEIDDAVLLGGFERGSVVGVSAEDVEFGLLVGLQTVAHALVFGVKQRAAIITTLPAIAMLPTLRDAVRAQVHAKFGPAVTQRQQEAGTEVKRCLGLISVSHIFDIEGLWEVLTELETPPSPSPPSVRTTTFTTEEVPSAQPEVPGQSPQRSAWGEEEPVVSTPPRVERTEVPDSDDEYDALCLPSPPPPPPRTPRLRPRLPTASPRPAHPLPPPRPRTPHKPASRLIGKEEDVSHIPDIILVTHFSTLLTNLFTRAADNDKSPAHSALQLLSSHLRYLARSSSAPLVMLLNTTTTTSASSSTSSTTATTGAAKTPTARPLELSLRSIFTQPLSPDEGGAGAGVGGVAMGKGKRQIKPAFGVTFAQFLDLHLLCTRVPRTKSNAEVLFAPQSAAAVGPYEARYCWVVEVLLDELRVWEWEGDDGAQGRDEDGVVGGVKNEKAKEVENKATHHQTKRWKRRNREQRWGAVDARSGVRIVDSFQRSGQEARIQHEPIRLVAGFGGPPTRGL